MSRLANRQISRSNARTAYFPLEGGLNTQDPALSLKPGEVISGRNYEIEIRGRYKRMQGYERMDGRPLASAETYYRLAYDTGALKGGFSSGFSSGFDPQRVDLIGGIITGGTSGATGIIVLSYVTVSSRDQNGSGYLILADVSGTFSKGEVLTVTINTSFTAGFSNGFL